MIKRILLIICLFIICLTASACEEGTIGVESASNNDVSMFVIVEQTSTWLIVYHKETKVMYSVSRYGHGSGVFTLLVDENGKPLLWEGE